MYECSSSRSRTDPEVVPRGRLPWVALASFPGVLADGDYRPRRSRIVTDDIILALHTPPRLSCLLVLPRLASSQPPRHRTSTPPTARSCSSRASSSSRGAAAAPGTPASSSTTRAPAVQSHASTPICPQIGGAAAASATAAASASSPTPPPATTRRRVIWTTTTPSSRAPPPRAPSGVSTPVAVGAPARRRHFPLGDHGTIAHRGRLWWVCLAHGLFARDPFARDPEMDFVQLPPLPPGETQNRIEQRRCVKVSQGGLCFVQVTARVALSTLDDAAAAANRLNPWVLAYGVTIDFPAPEPPLRVTLIDPDDRYVLYIMQENQQGRSQEERSSSSVVSLLDVRQRRLVACARSHNPPQDLARRSVVITHAWRLPRHDLLASSSSSAPPPRGTDIQSVICRTPATIRRALDALPPAPERFVVAGKRQELDALGWALYGRGILPRNWHDPWMDLLLYGRPDDMFWHDVWSRTPLALHDKALVEARRESSFHKFWCDSDKEGLVDLTDSITRVLVEHPGPVSCFRIDSSLYPDPRELDNLMRLLSEKGGAEEVMVLNLTRSADLEFPLKHIDNSESQRLKRLALGFFSIREGLRHALGAAWCCLSDMSLIACAFVAADMSHIISQLYNLQVLQFGFCSLSLPSWGECESSPELIMRSKTLKVVKMWECKSRGKLTVGPAPRLHSISLEVEPDEGKGAISIQISSADCASLFGIQYLHLEHHQLIFRGADEYTKIHTLGIKMCFSSNAHLYSLMSLLRRSPDLKVLQLWSLGSHCGEVGDDGNEDDVPCLRSSLEELTVLFFRGLEVEKNFVYRVISVAKNLKRVIIYGQKSCADSVYEAIKFLRKKASKVRSACNITIELSAEGEE